MLHTMFDSNLEFFSSVSVSEAAVPHQTLLPILTIRHQISITILRKVTRMLHPIVLHQIRNIGYLLYRLEVAVVALYPYHLQRRNK